jgi:hypothetical protein
MARLKEGLESLGLKAGGSLADRAQRLFSAKGVTPGSIPKKLLKASQGSKKGEDSKLAMDEAAVALLAAELEDTIEATIKHTDKKHTMRLGKPASPTRSTPCASVNQQAHRQEAHHVSQPRYAVRTYVPTQTIRDVGIGPLLQRGEVHSENDEFGSHRVSVALGRFQMHVLLFPGCFPSLIVPSEERLAELVAEEGVEEGGAAEGHTGEASSDEDDEGPLYNPLNLPLGWDGKPIPFWLYKLHGLSVE